MGSFASTCCVSGLPIEAGDPVRWLLLNQSPYDSHWCESTSVWVPRTWPIKAKYNDYGSIEEWEEGPVLDVILKGFQLDLMERGQGENSYHDPPVRKDMTFPHLLDAVWEDRVRVCRERHPPDEDEGLPESSILRRGWLPSYQPTLKKLEALFPDLQVDEFYPGYRIRPVKKWERSCDATVALLQEAKSTAEAAGYAAVVTASDVSGLSAQLLVYVAPGMTDELGSTSPHARGLWHGPHLEEGLAVRQGMIREDVWRQLLKLPIRSWGKTTGFSDYRETPKAYFHALQERRAEREERREKGSRLPRWLDEEMVGLHFRDQLGGGLLGKDAVPFLVGLSTHARLLDPVPESFYKTAAEFTYISDFLFSIRHLWHPSWSAGPQFGEWKSHREYFAALSTMRRVTK